MRSSYKKNNYGKLFEALASIYQPNLVVELGVLDGYSLLSLARASAAARVVGIDLFDEYEHNHGTVESIYDEAWSEQIGNIELIHKDAYEAFKDFDDESVDILHIDISNDAVQLEKLIALWYSKVRFDGLILFEGGSIERDQVEWMKKYNKLPVSPWKPNLRELFCLEYVTIPIFPSLTICRKICKNESLEIE